MKLESKQVIIALIVGVAFGVAGTLRFEPLCGRGHGEWQNPQKTKQHMMQKFTQKLSLTTGQQERISAIMEETRSKLDILRQESRPKFKLIREESKSRIREILTAAQQEKFDQMSSEMEKRWEKRRRGMPH